MKRREFIALVAGVAAWPLGGQAQQSVMPVIGYLSQLSPDSLNIVLAFREGLKEQGYARGQNVAIEFRFAEGQIDRLPALRVI